MGLGLVIEKWLQDSVKRVHLRLLLMLEDNVQSVSCAVSHHI